MAILAGLMEKTYNDDLSGSLEMERRGGRIDRCLSYRAVSMPPSLCIYQGMLLSIFPEA